MNSRVALGLCSALLALLTCSGCREHPRVTSRESLDLIKQVYTACNTRNVQRLDKCKADIAELSQSGQLTVAEKNSFERIMQLAEAGDWEKAQLKSLQFARDQVH